MTKAKYNSSVGIEYFWNLFRLRKKKYPKGYYFFTNHRNPYNYLKKPLYMALVTSYFDTYFEDFYSHNDAQYFPLSGALTKGKGKGMYKNQKTLNITDAVIWTWYLRPAMNYVLNLKIIKLTGSTSRLNKLEKKYKENFDAGLLPKVTDLLKELNTNDKLYR